MENNIWLPECDITAAYELALQAVEPHLRRQYAAQRLGKESATNRQRAILLGKEILLRLSLSGTTPADLMEWLDGQAAAQEEQFLKNSI